MIRIWGQIQYTVSTQRMLGCELFVREQQADGQWRVLPDVARIPPTQMVALLADTLTTLPSGLERLSFNMDQSQFVDPAYPALLRKLTARLPFTLAVELTERVGDPTHAPSDGALVHAAAELQAAGVIICLDDVGTGTNQAPLVQLLDPYVTEYKYALQNVRGRITAEAVMAEVAYWRGCADLQHKEFAIEGYESADDVTQFSTFKPDHVQGYYFSRPQMLVPASVFAMA